MLTNKKHLKSSVHHNAIVAVLSIYLLSACNNETAPAGNQNALIQDTLIEGTEQAKLISARTNRTNYSPYVTQDFPNTVYFGDTHLHTSYSFDAGMVGDLLIPMQPIGLRKVKL